MNLKRLYKLSHIMNAADIQQALYFIDDGKAHLAGADKDRSVVIHQSLIDNDISDKTMAVQEVPVLLKRLELFNLDNAKVAVNSNDTILTSVDIKERNKKISYTFTSPNKLTQIPKEVKFDDPANEIVINKNTFGELTKAIQSVGSPSKFTFVGDGDDIKIRLSDGASDGFEDVIGSNITGNWMYAWATDKFIKLIRYLMQERDEVKIIIGNHGTMRITIDELTLYLIPQVI